MAKKNIFIFKRRTKKGHAKQQGVALIQVLLISTIISILAIRFSFTAREQVNTAYALEQRVKANQKLQSTQSRIIYTLLTQKNTETEQPINLFPKTEQWNFHGKPFLIDHDENTQIKVAIQNSQGLLPQPYIKSALWHRVLKNMGYSSEQIKQKQGEIKDWQDSDTDSWLVGNAEPVFLANGKAYRNQTIQLPQEIAVFFEQEPQKLNIIKQISTQYSVVGLNLLDSPDLLLTLFFEPELAAEMIKQRNKNQLNKAQIIAVLGDAYDEELISFFSANRFKITIQVTLKDVKLQETIEIQFQPRKPEPVLIFARY